MSTLKYHFCLYNDKAVMTHKIEDMESRLAEADRLVNELVR